jgi:hypothetical protein
MKKIYYNINGWVCERYPYDIKIEDKNRNILVSEELYNETMFCPIHYSWRVIEGNLELHRYEETPVIETLNLELDIINNWFFENDWKINKVFLGEWDPTDLRWIDYLNERNLKRKRRDEINLLLQEAV